MGLIKQTVVIYFSQLFLTSSALAAVPMLEERFTLNSVFNMPESAVIDEAGEYIYVSNVNTYAKDGNGFISRVSISQGDLELNWLTGLDSPTGLAIHDGHLFAADFDQLIEVNLALGRIENRYVSPDSNPVLNDVAIDPDGTVYVSGSRSRSIYVLTEQGLEVWLQDDESLEFANGLLADGESVIHGGLKWTIFSASTKSATPILDNVNNFLSDIDGITADGCGGYLVTTVPDDQLWWVSSSGEVVQVAIGPVDGIDLHRRNSLIAIPRAGNSLTLYSFEEACEQVL